MKEAAGCQRGNLELNCNSTRVISIIWDQSFLGCNAYTDDCRLDDTKHVLASEGLHWELGDCNGESSCSMELMSNLIECSGARRYEQVTYQCIWQPDGPGIVLFAFWLVVLMTKYF